MNISVRIDASGYFDVEHALRYGNDSVVDEVYYALVPDPWYQFYPGDPEGCLL